MPKVHWSVVLGNWSWFKPWLIRNLFAGGFDMILPLGISLSSYAWSIFFPDKAMTRSISTIKLSVFLLLSAASIIFWFLTAPDIRFAGAIFWILCSGVILFVFGCSERLKKLLIFYVVFTLFYSFFLGPVINGKLEFIKIVANREGFVKAFRELRINLKRPTGLNKPEGFYEAPVIETRTFITDSGLKLYVPKDGTLCWDAPLPCTPYPNSHLKLRKDQSLGFGFRVEPWHEEDASVGMHL
jgi:hypothetical protein